MEEIWKEVNGYKVSNYGKIIGRKGKQLSTKPNQHGYLSCGVDLGEPYGKVGSQHRVIAFLFVDGYEDGFEVNHIDANKTNNRADNLEWCTHRHNMEHVRDNDLNPTTTRICVIDSNNKVVKVYKSMKQCAKETGLRCGNICWACQGKQDSAKGFRLRYFDEKKSEYKPTKFDTGRFLKKGKYHRKIKCITNGEIYESQKDAVKALGVTQSGLSSALLGKIKTTLGMSFEYAEDKNYT